MLPAILYMHGGGWVLGDARTHDRLVRELAVGVRAAVVFVEYDRSPEIEYPVALEQGYAKARWITENGRSEGLDATRLAVAGDSVGGNMTAALAILAGLSEAFVVVNENSVLRDEGEAYARSLSQAGVRTTCVRYNGVMHDFMMLNALRGTAAATGAIEQAIRVLRNALGT